MAAIALFSIYSSQNTIGNLLLAMSGILLALLWYIDALEVIKLMRRTLPACNDEEQKQIIDYIQSKKFHSKIQAGIILGIFLMLLYAVVFS